ncbi:MAG: hypothetical protein Q4B50_00510 [Bacillota bacterium]|nr:hypothetical protein [Bacillota bacterium]
MKKILLILLGIVLLLIVVLAIWPTGSSNNPEKQLEGALEQLFTGPNATYASFIQETLPSLGLETTPAEEVQAFIHSEVMNAILESNPEDGPMPDDVLYQCWDAGLYEIHSLCVGLNREMELKKPEITPTEIETIFVFTATVLCNKEAEKIEVPISGQASFDANGNLLSITFIDGLVELVETLE